MCRFLLQNGASWDICLMHSGICEMGPLPLSFTAAYEHKYDMHSKSWS